ncbi:hypothetical protein DAPPUDRAFT_324280 [Daphnia pulex]|uniref:E3 ubiquitin-protein ligase UBR4-like domain-containing protein n=1 Tax=Daphnia pulex TaxID=6669 RepID=E9H1F0_DAPPU|nr:hypothetical protein DAPPUDRAFT_324280 [Daphnia pulex]|eukprot:EFX74511.1 hypothetical protein DAPPUDRAFT_324280 [Daphnia pulex]
MAYTRESLEVLVSKLGENFGIDVLTGSDASTGSAGNSGVPSTPATANGSVSVSGAAGTGTGQINKTIQQICQRYDSECKSTVEELSKRQPVVEISWSTMPVKGKKPSGAPILDKEPLESTAVNLCSFPPEQLVATRKRRSGSLLDPVVKSQWSPSRYSDVSCSSKDCSKNCSTSTLLKDRPNSVAKSATFFAF